MFLTNKTCLLLAVIFIQQPFMVSAADCYGDIGVHPDLYLVQDIAAGICDSSFCDSAETECTLTEPIRNNVAIVGYRNLTTAGQYSYCIGAIQNIIDLCFNNAAKTYKDTGVGSSGVWSLDGQYYLIELVISEEYTWSSQRPVEVDVSGPDGPLSDSGDTDQYIYGPRHYCVGLGPGGAQGCLDINEGCFVVAPKGNTLPVPICG